ncbi:MULTISPECIES: hypothetical protein [Rhizobium]|uniref:hypothetical protein n=1 Tax=Rhizobium TaxID=379 RepID=UPI001A990DFC|nr:MULTISPECIES: hypothetical protein [Rhizobium]MBX4917794.1 hypothetical protein [Rhizobium bangladeshense]MBX4921933.1 hypothetical protein [Rhizobium bangladeshense]MBX5139235.1 hypothetical protein [Rhizobium lentis]QSY97591.1 hypothetical protein J2J97_25760 [Rhizobium bangladeshense]
MPLTRTFPTRSSEARSLLSISSSFIDLCGAGQHPVDKLPLETLIPANVTKNSLSHPLDFSPQGVAPGVSYGMSAKSIIFLPATFLRLIL